MERRVLWGELYQEAPRARTCRRPPRRSYPSGCGGGRSSSWGSTEQAPRPSDETGTPGAISTASASSLLPQRRCPPAALPAPHPRPRTPRSRSPTPEAPLRRRPNPTPPPPPSPPSPTNATEQMNTEWERERESDRYIDWERERARARTARAFWLEGGLLAPSKKPVTDHGFTRRRGSLLAGFRSWCSSIKSRWATAAAKPSPAEPHYLTRVTKPWLTKPHSEILATPGPLTESKTGAGVRVSLRTLPSKPMRKCQDETVFGLYLQGENFPLTRAALALRFLICSYHGKTRRWKKNGPLYKVGFLMWSKLMSRCSFLFFTLFS